MATDATPLRPKGALPPLVVSMWNLATTCAHDKRGHGTPHQPRSGAMPATGHCGYNGRVIANHATHRNPPLAARNRPRPTGRPLATGRPGAAGVRRRRGPSPRAGRTVESLRPAVRLLRPAGGQPRLRALPHVGRRDHGLRAKGRRVRLRHRRAPIGRRPGADLSSGSPDWFGGSRPRPAGRHAQPGRTRRRGTGRLAPGRGRSLPAAVRDLQPHAVRANPSAAGRRAVGR